MVDGVDPKDLGPMTVRDEAMQEVGDEVADAPPVIDSSQPVLEPKKGLGAEKNAQIMQTMLDFSKGRGSIDGILNLISQEDDKDLACEVVLNTMHDKMFDSDQQSLIIKEITSKAVLIPDQFAPSVAALVTYTYKHNLSGERFWQNPLKSGETLFVDDDGELISFEGEIGTIAKGLQGEGMNYIAKLGQYNVLSGPNKGKKFRGDLLKGEPGGRPIRGPKM